MRDLRDHLYTIMLFGGLTGVVFDFIAAAVEPVAPSLPIWLLYAVNILFILGEQICLPAFLFYSMAESGLYHRISGLWRLLPLAPFLTVVVLLALSPFGTGGIFYIDAQHIYRAGAAHWFLYACAGAYMLAACAILISRFREVDRTKRAFILIFVGIIACATLFQVYNPKYLLATSATALAITAMYYVLRAPGEQVDPFTGAFCRTVLPDILRVLHEKKRPCTMALYSVLNYDDVVRTHGSYLSDGLLVSMSGWLRATYPSDVTVYMNDADFTVVFDRILDENALRELRRSAPSTLTVGNSEIPVKLALAALVHKADSPRELPLTSMDFLFRKMHEERREDVYIADDAFQDRCRRLGLLEASMDRIVREGEPELLSAPVLYSGSPRLSPPAMVDVWLNLKHGELLGVAPDELLLAIRQSGNICWYYEQLIALTGEKAQLTDPSVRFCLPLLPSVLLQDDMAVKLFDMVTDSGMKPERIVLRMVEKDVSVELNSERSNLRRLTAFGFRLRLDEFAEGYTDMSVLGTLPIDSIMLDRSLLDNAGDKRGRALLRCVVGILRDIGKEVICAGADSAESAATAAEAGAPMLSGAWCPAPASVPEAL